MHQAKARTPRSRSFDTALACEHIDEIVGGINGHRQRFAHLDERLLIEEHTVVVDRFGRDQRNVEVIAIGERPTHVGANEQSSGRCRWSEERVLDANELEAGARHGGELIEQLGQQRRHRHARDDADATSGKPRKTR
jgi:hypothetical protein